MPRKLNPALMKPLAVSADLEAVVGKGPMPRSQVIKKLWEYIKKNDLQDAKNRRNINADEKLLKVFGGKKVVNMFEMAKLISVHLKNLA
jgi:chromatin remodeling complex protein RSC6